ncbi:UTP:RNA uridylyltransferase 1-like isoform X1 [Primulina huaijiensis]|uniref:UTP:RNA uridylyltransferase 1-like isoform X1 n=1 Tax=Primulina huaijiensis TaxID=1492673 RepID=UPI003CC7010F
MNRGDTPPPAQPVNGGEFLLQLLRKPSNSHGPTHVLPQSSQAFSLDPAVASVGSTIPAFALPQPPYGGDFPYRPWGNNPPLPFAPHNFFPQNPNADTVLNPDLMSPIGRHNHSTDQHGVQLNRSSHGEDMSRLAFTVGNSKPASAYQPEQNLIFGSVNPHILRNGASLGVNVMNESFGQRGKLGNSYSMEGFGMDRRSNEFIGNSVETNGKQHANSNGWRDFEKERRNYGNNKGKQSYNGNCRATAPQPQGFSSKMRDVRNWEYGNRTFDHNGVKGKGSLGGLNENDKFSHQLDSPGLPSGSNFRSVPVSNIEESMTGLHEDDANNQEESRNGAWIKMSKDQRRSELDDLEDQLVSSLGLGDESDEKSDKTTYIRDKDYRSDQRGQWIMAQRMRNQKRLTACRNDINRLNVPLIALYESLIPAEEEKVKQKQLLTVLEYLVSKEWPEARLYLYGSCANSFGFSKSDLDICLAMEDENVDKCEILLKLADILKSDHFHNVQALTRARVPIVKLMDPDTGISCDICVNNVLAVVNTKLLRDYAHIDGRLRQLAFIVKHWAKSRAVNETYQGTLSSYAYVLMCIHFLQQRRPAILPCLQAMDFTYSATVNNVEYTYFDKVENLSNFGALNGESIAQLVWAFFVYWAYCHDYANDVISIRMGCTLSKRAKDWTRRVGNDRHLICIEDPFEVSHDLGRVVDKYSIRVLREEFERAAQIMQYDSNPCVTLFEPYVPN